MPLGSEVKRRVVYFLTMKSMDKDKQIDPHFSVQKRNENGEITDLQNETEVSGKLLRTAHKDFEWEQSPGYKKKEKSIIVYLLDGDREYKIEANLNTGLARNLINKIISTDNFGTILFRLYEKNGHPNLYAENDGESMGWKYGYKEELEPLVDEMPNPQDPEGKKVKVFTRVNKKLLEDWIRHEGIVRENAKKKGLLDTANHNEAAAQSTSIPPDTSVTPPTGSAPADGPPPPSVEHAPPYGADDDDLPF